MDFVSAPYEIDKHEVFENHSDADKFFRPALRCFLVGIFLHPMHELGIFRCQSGSFPINKGYILEKESLVLTQYCILAILKRANFLF